MVCKSQLSVGQSLESERLLTVPQAAERLGCSPRAVWRLGASGDLPLLRIPLLGTRIREADLDAMIRAAAEATDGSGSRAHSTPPSPRRTP